MSISNYASTHFYIPKVETLFGFENKEKTPIIKISIFHPKLNAMKLAEFLTRKIGHDHYARHFKHDVSFKTMFILVHLFF